MMMKEGELYIDIEKKQVGGCCKARNLRKQLYDIEQALKPTRQ